jgi:hypothetical protein
MSDKKEGELHALVSLVDEQDPDIYAIIEQQIIENGIDIMPHLKEALENSFHEEIQSRIRQLISRINISESSKELINWKNMGAGNLLHGLFLIARYKNESLEINSLKKQLNELEYDIWIEMNNRLTLLEKIKIFNHVIFEVHGFKPNRKDFHNPSNSYINEVLTNKTGNPILMASLYIILAQKLGLPIYGVNVPEHFVCVAVNEGEDDSMSFLPSGEPLFYINAFSHGALFTRIQLANFLAQIKVPEKPEYFVPCSNFDIIIRVLNNLSFSYGKLNDSVRQQEIDYIKKGLLE